MNKQAEHMSRQERAIQDFMHNCLVMRKEEQIIDHILAELGKYYDADRVTVFGVDEAYTRVSKLWQWCAEGASLQTKTQPDIPGDGHTQWLTWLSEQGECFLCAASLNSQSPPEAGMLLKFRRTDCLMASPILVNERMTGLYHTRCSGGRQASV